MVFLFILMKNLLEICPESCIHPVVDDGVDAGVGHSQPVEEEVDVADVGLPCDSGVVVGIYEVDVVGCPAYDEYQYHYAKHFYNLKCTILLFFKKMTTILPFSYSCYV